MSSDEEVVEEVAEEHSEEEEESSDEEEVLVARPQSMKLTALKISDEDEEKPDKKEKGSRIEFAGDDSDEEGEWEHENDNVFKKKSVKQDRSKAERRRRMEEAYASMRVHGGVDVELVRGSGLAKPKDLQTKKEKLKHTFEKGKTKYYVRMRISWPAHIVRKYRSEAVSPNEDSTIEFSTIYPNIPVYMRGDSNAKNAWLKYPKLIFEVYEKGKLAGLAGSSAHLSTGEILLGTIIEPAAGKVHSPEQEVEIPLITKDGGHLQGKLYAKVIYTPVKKREETGCKHVTTTIVIPTSDPRVAAKAPEAAAGSGSGSSSSS